MIGNHIPIRVYFDRSPSPRILRGIDIEKSCITPYPRANSTLFFSTRGYIQRDVGETKTWAVEGLGREAYEQASVNEKRSDVNSSGNIHSTNTRPAAHEQVPSKKKQDVNEIRTQEATGSEHVADKEVQAKSKGDTIVNCGDKHVTDLGRAAKEQATIKQKEGSEIKTRALAGSGRAGKEQVSRKQRGDGSRVASGKAGKEQASPQRGKSISRAQRRGEQRAREKKLAETRRTQRLERHRERKCIEARLFAAAPVVEEKQKHPGMKRALASGAVAVTPSSGSAVSEANLPLDSSEKVGEL